MANMDFRRYCRMNGVPFWKIADKMNVHENTILRRLRHELPEEEKARLMAIVDEIVRGGDK